MSFRPRFCRSPLDFEQAAADWLKEWGFIDARRTRSGPDGGIDVESSGALAQVKAWMTPIGSPEIQQLRGVAHGGRRAIFFSLMHYTPAAITFADQAGVALFRFAQYDGTVEPVNAVASDVFRKANAESSVDTAAAIECLNALALDALQKMPDHDECGGFAILQVLHRKNRFIQFCNRWNSAGRTLQRVGLRGESVGDDVLEADERLTLDQQQILIELAWSPPAGKEPNWHRTWAMNEMEAAAGVAARTLVLVHGAQVCADVQVKISEF